MKTYTCPIAHAYMIRKSTTVISVTAAALQYKKYTTAKIREVPTSYSITSTPDIKGQNYLHSGL